MNLFELSIKSSAELLRKKEVSATELCKASIERIVQVDGSVNAFISTCPEIALEKAEAAQKKIDSCNYYPLTGIPMGIKDNICTMSVKTTCGSKMLENFVPPYNATAFEKLDAQSAVMMGKLNMDEFAMGGSTENSFFKKTSNPHDIKRVPGGSSGGSAASVASGEVAFALGSDTGGSIRQPASFCGVVGLKPTYGAVSRFGLVAFASSLDQIGPITRNVADCAEVLNAICGSDSKDSTCASYDHPDYGGLLGRDIKGLKIALPKEYLGEGLDSCVKDSVLKAAKQLESLGAICEEVSLPATEYAVPAYYLISSAEASSNLARYDGIKYGFSAEGCKTLAQLMNKTRGEGFGHEVKRRIMLGTYALSAGYYDAYFKKALKVRRIIKNGFDNIFEKYDLIIGPTAPTTAYPIGSKSDDPLSMYLGDIYTVPVNIAGVPALSINCGFDKDKMPIGLQIIGPAFSESVILQAAYAFEQSMPQYAIPQIIGGTK